MDRDMSIITTILDELNQGNDIIVESQTNMVKTRKTFLLTFNAEQFQYHVRLMIQANLIQKEDDRLELTWQGHEYIKKEKENIPAPKEEKKEERPISTWSKLKHYWKLWLNHHKPGG